MLISAGRDPIDPDEVEVVGAWKCPQVQLRTLSELDCQYAKHRQTMISGSFTRGWRCNEKNPESAFGPIPSKTGLPDS